MFIVDTLLQHFPILYVKIGDKELLVNANELLISKDCFLTLLKLDDRGENESLECSEIETESQYSGTTFGPRHRLGRQTLWVKFLTLIDCATRFIKEHSYTAHNR